MHIEEVMWLCAMRRDNWTDLVHSIYMLLWSFCKAWGKSVIQVFLYNCLTRLRSQTAASASERSDSIVLRPLAPRQVIFHTWKLLYSVASPIFLVIFSGSLPGSDDLVLFDSLDGNDASFVNVLCISLILNVGSIFSYWWIPGEQGIIGLQCPEHKRLTLDNGYRNVKL